MTRRFTLLAVLSLVFAGAATASAHDEYRIIGTIATVTARTITVRQTNDGKTIAMRTDASTLVTRDKTKVGASELKAGLSVVVDGYGDSLDDLVALEIRIVPPPARK